MADYDVVIIGSGLGGLLCANILSREGLNVCIVEKNFKPGGSLQTFGRKGTIFNTGLNYTESLDEGQVLNRYFKYLGVLDKLKLQKLDTEGFEVIDFPDGRYRFAMGKENFLETLSKDFPAERQGLKTYLEKIKAVCDEISMYSFSEKPSNMINERHLNMGAADYIRSVISNNRLQNILAGNSMLYSGTENKTQLFTHALINNSFIESAWRVAGGSHTLVNILTDNIVKNGGTIILKQKVGKLVVEEGKIGCAVLANGEKISGKHFIANIHPESLLNMTEPGVFRKVYVNRIRNLENTMGMFTLYLVFKKDTVPYVKHNFYHFNQDNAWIASDYHPEKWPQNYLLMHTCTAENARFADSASVITYMDFAEVKKWEHTHTGDRGEDYLDFKNNKAGILLDAVEKQFPGLRNHVAAYYTSTPLTWRDYTGTRAGSAYGLLKDFNRPLESLITPRTQISNLFLTGQNLNVHGILGVTTSAVVTCGELIDANYLIRKIKAA
ncbi:MAG: NAD(P)/FAD-dependent oxidoreductase [Bacteroidales bacterium]|nr:NAD(P)/FAD-dependent oxidoreductase [Bacteroidales bacterium]